MSPWKSFQDLRWGWKAVGGLLALLGALLVMVQVPIRENTADHTQIRAELGAVKAVQDTVVADLSLVRCWVRHEILNTDATVCLVGDGGTDQ